MKKKRPLPTIWEIPDELWKRMEPLIFRVRTGCQRNRIPRVYRDDATIHRTFQHWVELGLFERIWALLECEARYLDPLRKEGQKLSGATATPLCATLVT